MNYLSDEIKLMLYSLIVRKTKLGWNFQGHKVSETMEGKLMFTIQFSRKKSTEVTSEYCFKLDKLDGAKHLIQLWILNAKEPYEKTK